MVELIVAVDIVWQVKLTSFKHDVSASNWWVDTGNAKKDAGSSAATLNNPDGVDLEQLVFGKGCCIVSDGVVGESQNN